MKYYVILLATYNDGKADKKAIYECKDENDAVATFHSNMGTFMKDPTVKTLNVRAINDNGGEYENGIYRKEEE